MPKFQHRFLQGTDQLEAIADQWNNLWQRSSTRLPSVRAEGVQNWVKHFDKQESFTALCVETAGQLVAALPLVADKICGAYPTYKLTTNCWANAGDLLIDRNIPYNETTRAVAAGLQELNPAILSFEEITLSAPQWIALQQALSDCGGSTFCKNRSPVGVIDILDQWETYEQSWSSNHRGAVKRTYRKLAKQGELRVERCQEPGEQMEQMLRKAFAIEDLSWKGEACTSVLKTPGMLQYMLDEAQSMAASGYSDVWLLYFNDKPIAFEYCHFAKNTCFSHKIGYDPQHSKFGPGRLLRYLQLQEYYADGDCRLFDMLGTLCTSKAKWATRTYEVGNLYATAGNPLSNTLLSSYAWAIQQYRALRKSKPSPMPKLGAASYLAEHANATTSTPEYSDGVIELAVATAQ